MTKELVAQYHPLSAQKNEEPSVKITNVDALRVSIYALYNLGRSSEEIRNTFNELRGLSQLQTFMSVHLWLGSSMRYSENDKPYLQEMFDNMKRAPEHIMHLTEVMEKHWQLFERFYIKEIGPHATPPMSKKIISAFLSDGREGILLNLRTFSQDIKEKLEAQGRGQLSFAGIFEIS